MKLSIFVLPSEAYQGVCRSNTNMVILQAGEMTNFNIESWVLVRWWTYKNATFIEVHFYEKGKWSRI